MFNYTRQWKGQLGAVKFTQSVHPLGDGEELHIVTTTTEPAIRSAGSNMPWTDAEKLADDSFRMEIARRDLAKLSQEQRLLADAIDAGLAEDREAAINGHVRRDERNGRHTP